jgi:hypothetical protein
MTRYLLDGDIMGAFINHRSGVPEKVREAQARGSRIGTCMPVVAELYYGIEFSATRDENATTASAVSRGLLAPGPGSRRRICAPRVLFASLRERVNFGIRRVAPAAPCAWP